LERARAFGPVSAGILYKLAKLDLALGDFSDEAKVLAHVVAPFHPVQADVSPDQAKSLLPLLQHPDHLERLERKCFERLFGPVLPGSELAQARGRLGDQLDLRGSDGGRRSSLGPGSDQEGRSLDTGELGAGGAPKYDPAFLQGSWGRLEVQNRQIVSDAGRLHQILVTEAEQVSRTTTILNICLMGVLALLALANYLLIYRRTSLGLAALERGTEIVGGGDLDFRIPDERRDEIGDLSRAFNRMTAELNGVTASKKDLEKEIMARELVEAERERLLVKEQKLGEELNVVNEELRTQNDELIQHQMVLAAQNADLVEAREEAARLLEKQRDLFLRLQEALLDIPKEFPGVRFGHLYRSATEEAKIGGDFYDVFEAKNGKVGLLIGDVSGHGINAARIASLTKDTIRAFSHQFRRPHLVLRETNRLLIQRNLTGFVTVFLGFLDPESGILVHSSAGHPPPILAADGSATTIESIGSPLGVFPTSRYRDNDTRLDPGSIVVLYTDGITEARRDNLFFGDRGLLEAVLAMSDHSAEELPSLLLERALEFSRGMLADDVALLAVEYEGPTQGSRGA